MKNQPKKWLRILMAVVGCGLMVATIPAFTPVSVLATVHGWLGLGEFPDAPIAIYLARSTSMLYAVHGALMLVVSLDMDRYLPLLKYFGWLHVAIGLGLLGIDLTAPMPWYWTTLEGLPIALTGLVIVWLQRLASRDVG